MSIALVPAGKVEPEVLLTLKEGVGKAFGKEVVLLDAMDEPLYALDRDRGQCLSTTILRRIMDEEKCAGYERVLAIVDRDLYADGLNFVFGEALARVSVISTARLKESFYGLEESRSLLLKRALTEAVHELGHTFGLGHCYNTDCTMFFSNSIVDTDRKGPEFCRACSKSLASP